MVVAEGDRDVVSTTLLTNVDPLKWQANCSGGPAGSCQTSSTSDTVYTPMMDSISTITAAIESTACTGSLCVSTSGAATSLSSQLPSTFSPSEAQSPISASYISTVPWVPLSSTNLSSTSSIQSLSPDPSSLAPPTSQAADNSRSTTTPTPSSLTVTSTPTVAATAAVAPPRRPPYHKTQVIPIAIPLAMVAAAAIGFLVWYFIWRGYKSPKKQYSGSTTIVQSGSGGSRSRLLKGGNETRITAGEGVRRKEN